MKDSEINKKQKKEESPNYLLLTLIFILMVSGLSFLVYNLLFNDSLNQANMLINSLFIFTISIVYGISILVKKTNPRNVLGSLGIILIISYIAFNSLVSLDIITLPTKQTVPSFINEQISELDVWATKNNITIIKEEVYSDDYEEGIIISQSINEGVLLKGITEIKVVISKGPNYNESVIIPIMDAWTIDDLTEFISKNFLNNVTINYEINEEIEKNLVINQSVKGEMYRSSPLTVTLSLGSKDSLVSIDMINLKNKSLFEATLWLKQNAIKYDLIYEYSDSIKRNYIISTDKAVGETITPLETKINIMVSNGKKIIVPNLNKMSNEEIVKWISDNNLKIEFIETYSSTVDKGSFVNANYKKDDVIKEGTKIEITISKGSLKLETFKTISELRNWAANYEIKLSEDYEFNSSIVSGNIISVNPNFGSSILPTDTIEVVISNGSGIKIPNFVGKTKSYITSQCTSLGLKCSFQYGSYSSSVSKDTATSQNKKSGGTVIKGTSLVITLSKGKAGTHSLVIQDSWFTSSIISYNSGVTMLKGKFTSLAPNVTFNFVKKTCESLRPGYIHPSSPIKGGTSITVTEGQTYQVWLCG